MLFSAAGHAEPPGRGRRAKGASNEKHAPSGDRHCGKPREDLDRAEQRRLQRTRAYLELLVLTRAPARRWLRGDLRQGDDVERYCSWRFALSRAGAGGSGAARRLGAMMRGRAGSAARRTDGVIGGARLARGEALRGSRSTSSCPCAAAASGALSWTTWRASSSATRTMGAIPNLATNLWQELVELSVHRQRDDDSVAPATPPPDRSRSTPQGGRCVDLEATTDPPRRRSRPTPARELPSLTRSWSLARSKRQAPPRHPAPRPSCTTWGAPRWRRRALP